MTFFALEQCHRLHDGYQRAFKVEGQDLLLCQLEGQVFIIENRCPHMDVSLTEAVQLPGKKLRCRAHGIEFDMVTAKACGPLADTLDCLRHFPVVYEGTQIGVELD